jgi:DNA-directed RNA polymerase specialized sigma24 family protein
MSGLGLAAWLKVLAAEEAPRASRNEAAGEVMRILEGWVPSLLRSGPCKLSRDDMDDVAQHVLIKASLGTARFRGESDGEAYAWIKRIVRNKAIDICRANKVILDDVPSEDRPAEAEAITEERAYGAALRRIEETIWRRHRKNDAESLVLALRCHLDARYQAIDDQIERYGYQGQYANEPRDEAGRLRARNRVYQYRKRGREAGCGALTALVAERVIEADEAMGVARFLGCKGSKAAANKEKVLS